MYTYLSSFGSLSYLEVKPACGVQDLVQRVQTESVWTIDLAYLFASYGVPAEYYTISPGVDPSYSDEDFYEASFVADSKRVTDLFAKAPARHVHFEKRHLDLVDIVNRILGGFAAIMLVDSGKLHHKLSQEREYHGHYIVVYGYNPEMNMFAVIDPARRRGYRAVEAARLEAARLAHGTDEDALFMRVLPVPPEYHVGEAVKGLHRPGHSPEHHHKCFIS
mmetsp:Transcript_232/g.495  ORF Transcript_232/g.495 Transcript_232/m.495 type:complete len:220 (+) Transcript_232:52-711(+)